MEKKTKEKTTKILKKIYSLKDDRNENLFPLLIEFGKIIPKKEGRKEYAIYFSTDEELNKIFKKNKGKDTFTKYVFDKVLSEEFKKFKESNPI